jgi:hypothetical protein
VGKVAYRRIAEQFHLSLSTISRHKEHVPAALLGEARAAKNQEDSELAKATDKLLAEIRGMQRRLRTSRKRNTIEVADLLLKISREIRALLELRSRFAGPRSQAQRATPSPREAMDPDDAEITAEEADQIAAKWLARRGEKLDSEPEPSTKVTTPAKKNEPTS